MVEDIEATIIGSVESRINIPALRVKKIDVLDIENLRPSKSGEIKTTNKGTLVIIQYY